MEYKQNNKILSIIILLAVSMMIPLTSAVGIQGSVEELKINEVVSNPQSGNEWVEIYNTGIGSIDLSDCKLEDKIGTPLFLTGILNGGDYAAFDYSQSVLNNAGDTVTLVCNNNDIDSVGYGDSGNAPNPDKTESIGRCTDGTDTDNDADDFHLLTNPTKAAANDCQTQNIILGCIDIIKEVVDTQGNLISPVPQFQFELNGGEQTTNNDANGRARFEDVTPGFNTVTESGPSGWSLHSVTPANGEVFVQEGGQCVTVLFKNVQEDPGIICGDGILQTGEQCDDGNNNNGDGCSAICEIEQPPEPICGNGIIETGEECDGGTDCQRNCKRKPTNRLTPNINTEDFEPLLWQCDSRVVYDDAVEPGRISPDGTPLIERTQNYAFEGEQISWKVLVMDKNGIEKIKDVYATTGNQQGTGNDIQVNCQEAGRAHQVDPTCNARILEESLNGKDLHEVAGYWECTLTVETPNSMYGEHWITVEAEDYDGMLGTIDEHEYWFLNPALALSIEGDLSFENVRPGTSSYSNSLLVGNDADSGSGVMLDMFISGTDFYDTSSSGAACPTTNQLGLEQFRYYVANGAYSSHIDPRSDSEGYVPINYGIGFNDPNPFYGTHEILQTPIAAAGYYAGNILAPGAEMALTFRLNLPEPCNGDFDSGNIYFWGEAV